MATNLTKLTAALDIIQGLEDLPNDTGTPPLSAAELKAKFDEAAGLIKTYINSTLTEEVETAIDGKLTAPEDTGTNGQYLQSNGDGTTTWSTPLGAGDMLMSVYDQDGDGVVDSAESCTGNAATATALLNGRVTTKLILDSNCYGNTLPTNDYTAGRIFFKKV